MTHIDTINRNKYRDIKFQKTSVVWFLLESSDKFKSETSIQF